MTPGYVRRLEQALALAGYGDPKPRLTKLYADAMSEWNSRKGASHDLHELLVVMAFETKEISELNDRQIRLAYEIRGAA